MKTQAPSAGNIERDYDAEIAAIKQQLSELMKLRRSCRGPIKTSAQNFIAMLGIHKDIDIAAACGLSRERIRQIRTAMGIPRVTLNQYEAIAAHAKEHGAVATAKEFKVSKAVVGLACRREGVKPLPPKRSKEIINERYGHLLGVVPDAEIARIAGVHNGWIYELRKSLGIPAQKKKRGSNSIELSFRWNPAKDALLGKMADSVVALQLGITACTVYKRRKKLGIASYHGQGKHRKGTKFKRVFVAAPAKESQP